MLKKFQQYYIFKFETSRLKKERYRIELDIKQGRKNGEVVGIGDSQMLRSLRSLKGQDNNPEVINELFLKRKRIRNKQSNKENVEKLLEIEKELNSLLFVPEIVSVVIKDNRHYQNILDDGFFINKKRYVRLLCGAGNARRDTVIFIDIKYEEGLKKILENGYDHATKIAPAKFNAYFALSSTATIEVSEPYFCVIPDCITKRTEKIEFVEEGILDDIVSEKDMELEFNLFDGMGLISPRGAQMWADELELDYIPSSFVIRNSFLKGMVSVFDFHAFSEQIGRHIIKDIWGNDVNTRDMDLILSESQLKLWNAYTSISDYRTNCKQNRLKWGISRHAPKEDKKHVFSNYQFLQVLDLDKDQVEGISSKTLEYFDKTMSGEIEFLLLYLLGKNSKTYDENIFDKIGDNVAKALVLNNSLIEDTYIQNYIASSLNKKIKESYIGNLLLNGNYSTMISDP